MKRIRRNSGVTIIILVITIIVLLILAGVSIRKVLGDNGIIRKGEDSSLATYIMRVTEDAKMAYRDCYEEKQEDIEIGSTVTTADVAVKMINKYRI